jgi:uncharacterized protein (PEP-CTERM system associated)
MGSPPTGSGIIAPCGLLRFARPGAFNNAPASPSPGASLGGDRIYPSSETASGSAAGTAADGTPITPTGASPAATSGGSVEERTALKRQTVTPSIAITETLTNNVNLTSSEGARGDLVSLITPSLTIDEMGTRTCLRGTIAAPVALYVKTGGENNTAYPSVSLIGNAEILERIFFIEGAILASEQFLTPFGAQPADLSNATQNRYTAANYRVSPYIKGTTSDGIRYELRNNNTWTNLSGAPIATNNAYYSEWRGNVASPVAQVSWSLDYDWNDVKFNDQSGQISELTRASLFYQVDPSVRVSVDGGYEDNRYTFTDYHDAIYGVGVQWRPTPRTNLVANWEHRFFGSSYLVGFDHRTPLSAVSARFSRNITSYPQTFLTIPPTGNVPLLLDVILSSRFPDPAQRQQIVDALITDRGLPTSISGPVNLYTQQIYLQEDGNLTLGLLGARNVVLIVGYYRRTEAITGAGGTLPPELAGLNDNTQKGVTVNWTHSLDRMLTLNATGTVSQTVAIAPLAGKTNQGLVSLRLTSILSPNTTAFVGARYQKLSSNVANDYNEAALFAGFNYIFK